MHLLLLCSGGALILAGDRAGNSLRCSRLLTKPIPPAYSEKHYAKTTVRSLVNTLFGKNWTNFGQLKSSTERTSAGAEVFADVQLLPVEDAQVAEV